MTALPLGASPGGVLFNHETGTDADGEAMGEYMETGYFDIEDGEQLMFVSSLVPDFQNFAGTLSVYVKLLEWPNSTPRVMGPYTITASTTTTPAGYATTTQANAIVTLVNELRAKYELHRLDAGDGLAHLASDTTNAIAAPVATDLATAITLGNELKADYNAHRSQSGVHHNNDAGNAVSSTNASDQSSLNTLLNEMKGDLNAHLAAAPTNCAPGYRVVDA